MQEGGYLAQSNNLNSRDPAMDGNLGGIVQSIVKNMMLSVDSMLPAEVIRYDRVKNIASVRPLIARLGTSGEAISRPAIADVPVLALGGNFTINFPLDAGAKGWILAADRDISLFKQSLSEEKPNTLRTFSFADSLFIPDSLHAFTLNEKAGGKLSIQSNDGQTAVLIGDDSVQVISTGDVEVESSGNVSVKSSGSVTIDAGGDVSVTSGGNVEIAQAMQVTINAQANVSITAAQAEVTAPAINLNGAVTIGGALAVAPAGGGGAASIDSDMNITGTLNVVGALIVNGVNIGLHTHGGVTSGNSKTSPPM